MMMTIMMTMAMMMGTIMWLSRQPYKMTSKEPLKSAIHKKMAPRFAFWVDRPVGSKFTVFVWESDGK